MLNGWRVFVDTNVLLYLEDLDDSVKHELATTTLRGLRDRGGAVVSNQIFAEFSNQLRGVLSADGINQRISDYKTSFQVLSYTVEDIGKANQLLETYKIHFFDALIAATMNSNNIDTIITENEKDFKKIPWLKIINPFKEAK